MQLLCDFRGQVLHFDALESPPFFFAIVLRTFGLVRATRPASRESLALAVAPIPSLTLVPGANCEMLSRKLVAAYPPAWPFELHGSRHPSSIRLALRGVSGETSPIRAPPICLKPNAFAISGVRS